MQKSNRAIGTCQFYLGIMNPKKERREEGREGVRGRGSSLKLADSKKQSSRRNSIKKNIKEIREIRVMRYGFSV